MNVTEEIKSRLDLTNIVGSSVHLKRTGKNYKGLCPFHDEKTPSFIVFPETQTWRCFGCGRGGDLFSYVMEHEGWEFSEALRNLAEMAGVELAPPTPRQQEIQEKSERLLRILSDAADYFTRYLLEAPDAEPAREYVNNRGLSQETLRKFGVGYAPDSWDNLSNYLLKLGHAYDDIAESGLLVLREDGRSYDRFRDRVTIAIKDNRGRVVGFGARGLARDATPKYINSPQSEIFDKSHLLFGFPEARRSIRELDTAVIVEGYMDVMQAHQAGFDNVVAQMGTALTETQLNLVSRYTNHLILALDPDTAGQMATSRGREVIERVTKGAAKEAAKEGVWNFDEAEGEYRAKLTPEIDPEGIVRYKTRTGFDIRVIILPPGKDPDLLIRESPGEWARLISEAMPVIDYVIQRTVAGKNLTDAVVKSEVADKIVPLINELANPVERTHYRQYLARLLRVDERTFFPDQINQRSDKRAGSKRRGNERPTQFSHHKHGDRSALLTAPTYVRETYCLAAILQKPYMLYEFNRILGDIFSYEGMPQLYEVSWEVLPDYFSGMLVAEDFANMQNRLLYQFWNAAVSQDEFEPLVYVQSMIDEDSHIYLNSLLTRPLAAIGWEGQPVDSSSSEDTVRERTLMTLLALRGQRVENALKEITFLLDEESNSEANPALQKQIVLLMVARKRITGSYKSLTGRNHEMLDN